MKSPVSKPLFFAFPFHFKVSTTILFSTFTKFIPYSSKLYSVLKVLLSITNNLYLSPYALGLVTLKRTSLFGSNLIR